MPGYKHPCRACGKLVERDAAACPYCGQSEPAGPGRCPSCRSPVEDDWPRCGRCGRALGGAPADPKSDRQGG